MARIREQAGYDLAWSRIETEESFRVFNWNKGAEKVFGHSEEAVT
jgi:hypothetical protein